MARLAVGTILCYCVFLTILGSQMLTWTAAKRDAKHNYPELSEFMLVLPYTVLFLFLHLLGRRVVQPLARWAVVWKKRWSKDVYEVKLERFCSAVFKAIFFISFTGYSYMAVLREAAWVPPALFGSGSESACWGLGNAGETQESPSVAFKGFYQVAMAYHLSELVFQLMFELSKPDLVEMMVHHSTTCFLIFSSFYMNYMRIGSLVLFLHDFSDIPVYITKILVDTPLSICTFLNYLGMLVSWGYLRLYVFPRFVIQSVIYAGAGEIPVIGEKAWAGFAAGLSLLLCLHVYWYSKFLQMGWHFLSSGETKDMQANISAMDLKNLKKQT